MDQGARKRLGHIQALLLIVLSEMKRHVHNIERIPRGELQGGPEGNIIPTLVQEQKICSSRRHDCEQDPL